MLGLDLIDDFSCGSDFLRCGMPVQHAQEQLVDHLLVVRHVGDELGAVSGLIHVNKEAAKTECVSSMLDTDEEEILNTLKQLKYL